MFNTRDDIDAEITFIKSNFNSKKEHLTTFIDKLKSILNTDDSISYELLSITLLEELELTIPILNSLDHLFTCITSLQTLNIQYQTKLQKSKTKRFTLKTDNSALLSEINSKQSHYAKLEEDYDLLSNEYYVLLNKYQDPLERQHDNNDDTSARINHLKKDNETLLNTIHSFESDLSILKEENKQLKGTINLLNTGFNGKFILKSLSENKVIKLNSEVLQLSKQIEHLQFKIDRLTNENEQLELDNQCLMNKIDDYNKESTKRNSNPTNTNSNVSCYNKNALNYMNDLVSLNESIKPEIFNEEYLLNNLSFCYNDEKTTFREFSRTPNEIIESMTQNDFRKILPNHFSSFKNATNPKYKLFTLMLSLSFNLTAKALNPLLYNSVRELIRKKNNHIIEV